MNKKSLVTILIINWNGRKHLKKLLPTLSKITYTNYEVIVVDQASTDGSLDYLNQYYPNIKIVKLDKNYGFAKANNIGVKHARGELVLLLNNDTEVEPDFLDFLVQAIKPKDVGIVQPKICFSNKKQIQSTGSFMTSTGFLYHRGFGAPKSKYNQSDEIFSANGACMLIKKKLIKKIGLFDEQYFAYFEETDFCWRAWLFGYKILYVPKAVIYHKGGQTSQFLASDFVQFHSFKNRMRTILKNLSLRDLAIILPIHLLLAEAAAIAFLFKKRLGIFLAINKAIGWNIVNINKTLQKRRVVQETYRKNSDKKIFDRVMINPSLSHFLNLFNHANAKEDN